MLIREIRGDKKRPANRLAGQGVRGLRSPGGHRSMGIA